VTEEKKEEKPADAQELIKKWLKNSSYDLVSPFHKDHKDEPNIWDIYEIPVENQQAIIDYYRFHYKVPPIFFARICKKCWKKVETEGKIREDLK